MSNNGGVYTYSKVAASNAAADSTQNWAEGMAPSAVNDSARAGMASVAKWRDDISGSIVTTGTSAAYIVTSNQNFDTLADFAGQVIAFSPHITNAAGPVTMTVDGFANLPLRTSPGKELLAGTIIQGTSYVAVYNNVDGSLYLQGFFGAVTTYNIPLAAGLPFFAPTAPNSAFAFPYGQQISQTVYSALYALLGNTYGTATGGLFYLPDVRGRVLAGKDDMGGSAANRLTSGGSGINGVALNGSGGAETHTLVTANLPPYTPSGIVTGTVPLTYQNILPATGGTTVGTPSGTEPITATFAGNAQGGTSTPVITVQPTIVCNYIIRVI